MSVSDSRKRNRISLRPTKIFPTSIPTKHIPNILLSNALFVFSLHASKYLLFNLNASVFWVVMRLLACGSVGVLFWEAWTGNTAKRMDVEWSVMGLSSILLFVQQGSLFTALYWLPCTRVISFTHFSTLWTRALIGITTTRRTLLVGIAVLITIVPDSQLSSLNLSHTFVGYGSLVLYALSSFALEHTHGVMSPALGNTFTVAVTVFGASVFALLLYLLRNILLGYVDSPDLPLSSLAIIPIVAYSLLLLSPTTTMSLNSLSFSSLHFTFSYPIIVAFSMVLGALAFSDFPTWSDFLVAGFLYGGMYPESMDAIIGPPSAPTSRLLKSYLKSILSKQESRKIFYFLCLNMCYMTVQMLYGVWTNSLGLISDAIHMAFDCLAIAVGLFASVMATWEPNERFTYGYGRIETLSGFANGIFLILISIFIVFEAIQRLLDPPEMNTSQLLLISSLGLGVNLFGMFAMGGHHHGHNHSHAHSYTLSEPGSHCFDQHDEVHTSHSHHPHATGSSESRKKSLSPINLSSSARSISPLTPSYQFGYDEHLSTQHPNHSKSMISHDGHSHNMRGVFLHVMADTLGSVGVIISTVLIQLYGWTGFDPIASMFIAVMITSSVVPLVLDTGRILALDMADRDQVIENALSELPSVPGLASYTFPRFWPKDSSTIIGSIHIQLSSSLDLEGPLADQGVSCNRLDHVVERVDSLLREKIPGLEKLTVQAEA